MKEIYVNSAGGRFYWSYVTGASLAIMQVTVSVVIIQLKVSAANMWVIIVIVIMHVGVSVAIMQSIIHMTVFTLIMQVTVSVTAM